ncbi:MAG: cupin domain-containing protein [Candidatus Binatia bacterium]
MIPDGHQTARERSLLEYSLEPSLSTFDLPALLVQLKHEDPWLAGKRNAMTLLKDQGLRVVLIVIRANITIPSHQGDSPLSMQVVEGRVQVRTNAEPVTLTKGQILALKAGIRHEFEALEESAFLLTLATGQSHPAESAGDANEALLGFASL